MNQKIKTGDIIRPKPNQNSRCKFVNPSSDIHSSCVRCKLIGKSTAKVIRSFSCLLYVDSGVKVGGCSLLAERFVKEERKWVRV